MRNLSAASSGSSRAEIKKPLMKRAIVAVCTVAVLVAASVGAYAYYKTPTSYLSLDINPSVELGVNDFGKVVTAEAYNNDGQTILDGQNVIGSDVESAVGTLVTSAAQNGFVAKDGSTVIAVTSETDSSTTAAAMEDAAVQGADSAVKAEGETATVQKENVALERRDEARKLGITPGKLNLIQKLQKLDPSITVDEYKSAKVTAIMKKYVELKKSAKDGDGSSSADENSQAPSAPSGQSSARQESSRTSGSKAEWEDAAGSSATAGAADDQTASSAAEKTNAGKSSAKGTAGSASSDAAGNSSGEKINAGKSAGAANAQNGNAGNHANHGQGGSDTHKK